MRGDGWDGDGWLECPSLWAQVNSGNPNHII